MKTTSKDFLDIEASVYSRLYDLSSVAAVIKCFKEGTRDLFHYTARGRAKYLIGDNANIVCKHTGLMDDIGEVKEGTYLLTTYMGALYPYVADEIRNFLDKAWCEYEAIPHGGWDEYRDDDHHPMRNMIMHLMPYIFCLMPESNSTYQWRNYSDRSEGGYCFAFSHDKLEQAIQSRNSQLKDSVLYLLPCLYKEITDEKIDLIAHSFLVDREADFRNFDLESKMRILSAIFTLAPLIKNKKFFREQEYRLILVNHGAKVIARKSSGLKECGFRPLDLMQTIAISPHGNQKELRADLVSLCPAANDKVTDSRVSRSVVENYIAFDGDVSDEYEDYVIKSTTESRNVLIASQDAYIANRAKEASNV